ncbi:MAG: bifunctional biotin--[acetyl-CoA-carboxylase] synthetase/biotin operon repressor, partial [Dehalococcoidia bacterium]|nr:bifunctional biotin--[acetyl-CoA-carboxylase] synthetase/biotin operon repressor [Dehalococcoidia bacterium]
AGFASTREKWKTLNNTIGSRVKISGIDGEMVGDVLDIDHDGFLLLKGDDGKVRRIVSGDVSLRPHEH